MSTKAGWAPAREVGVQVTGSPGSRRRTSEPPRGPGFACWGDLGAVQELEPPHFLSAEVLIFLLPPVSFLQHLCRHLLPSCANGCVWTPTLGYSSSAMRPCPGGQSPPPGVPSEKPGSTLDHHTCPGRPSVDCSGRKERKAVPLPLAGHTPLRSPARGPCASRRQQTPRMRPLGLTATLRVGTGEAQPRGCSLMRQLAPVKRPNENKRGGEGEHGWRGRGSAIQPARTAANLY